MEYPHTFLKHNVYFFLNQLSKRGIVSNFVVFPFYFAMSYYELLLRAKHLKIDEINVNLGPLSLVTSVMRIFLKIKVGIRRVLK